MREIYLDNNATTPVAAEVLGAMLPYLRDQYGNPSSLHRKGREAERAINSSRMAIAQILGLGESEIVFTSSGTEADNLAIKGAARSLKGRGNHLITTTVEHPAVLESCQELEGEGFRVTYLEVDRWGCVNPEGVKAQITSETVLVSIMHVNNELGTIFPIKEIAQRVKRTSPQIVFHSDGAQAVGKLPMDLGDVDLYTISGHKIHAPKGIGALAIRQGIEIKPILSGGGQERRLRPGTQNVAGIVALAKAIELAYDNWKEKAPYLAALRERLVSGLRAIAGVRINSPEDGVATTVNASFPGIPAEVMLHGLEAEGVFVSAGAACASKETRRSHVLVAAGIPPEEIDSSLRFSFSRYTNLDDIELTLRIIKTVVHRLQAVETLRH